MPLHKNSAAHAAAREPALANLTIEAAYRDRTPGSAALAAKARNLFPSGITHDGRHLEPYGVYIERGEGAHKWDVDGNRYIDYYGGHGALLLGHNHPKVSAAIQSALERGTHFGASHALEVRWAEAVRGLMPSAERIRFTSSGTEATLMAVRLARSFTGRRKILRIRTHFHGWHDHMTSGYQSHFDGAPTVGVLPGVAEQVVLADPNDVDGLRRILAADREIAAAIVEPTGGSFGMVPLAPSFLVALRELTAAHGALLIFDEVVTGFRVAPGGAQAHFSITPDLTTLAKIVAGGMPGGAVAGRADVLAALDFFASAAAGTEKIQHPGTFNANPVSAAAGIAALDVIATTDACDRANAAGAALRRGFNEVLEELRRAVGRLRHLLGRPSVHQPQGARAAAFGLRSVRDTLRRAQVPAGPHHASPAHRHAAARRGPQQLAGCDRLRHAQRSGSGRYGGRLPRRAAPLAPRGRSRLKVACYPARRSRL